VKSISVKIEQISSVFPSNIGLLAIKLELISSPPGHPLASGVTEASILRAAAEIGAIYVNKKVSRQILLLLIIFQIISVFLVAEESQTRASFHQWSNG